MTTLNWRTKRNRTAWYTGPSEGTTIHYAKKGGVEYHVQAHWREPFTHQGEVVWRAFCPTFLGGWSSLDAAKRACERKAFPLSTETP